MRSGTLNARSWRPLLGVECHQVTILFWNWCTPNKGLHDLAFKVPDRIRHSRSKTEASWGLRPQGPVTDAVRDLECQVVETLIGSGVSPGDDSVLELVNSPPRPSRDELYSKLSASMH
jgi:hypothetical protein